MVVAADSVTRLRHARPRSRARGPGLHICAPLGRRSAAPAPERPREHARRGVAERVGDLAHLDRRIFQHLPGALEARLVQELLEGHAESVEAAIQRAAVHPEERGDLVGFGLSRHERRVQHPAHLRREVVGVELARAIRSAFPADCATHHRCRASGASGIRRRTAARTARRRSATVPGKTAGYGPTSAGMWCANQTSVGLQSGPHSSCMML